MPATPRHLSDPAVRRLAPTAPVAPHANGSANRLLPSDRPAHGWYRFVLSFPPHLVRHYLERFGIDGAQRVLDPFCGTGTVLVECKKLGIASAGIEANPLAAFASRVKTDWRPPPDALTAHAGQVAELALAEMAAQGLPEHVALPLLPASAAESVRESAVPSPPEDAAPSAVTAPPSALRSLLEDQHALLLSGSISPLPLHRTLVLLDCLQRQHDARFRDHERLALAGALVTGIGNLRFSPEVGVGPPRADASAVHVWLAGIESMAEDLASLARHRATPAVVHHADARDAGRLLPPASIDAVITSPPYPNEKDYTRATRLESVLLGFIPDRRALRALKHGLVRSNTRGVYAIDDDHRWVAGHPEIERIAREIEERRLALGKTSGFERLYARVTRLYFGGMARHLAELRPALRPGARLAYVVGDQASYLRVMIRTGTLLADIAERQGYVVEGIDLFRTRRATATRDQLREEVVLLRWPGAFPQSKRAHPTEI